MENTDNKWFVCTQKSNPDSTFLKGGIEHLLVRNKDYIMCLVTPVDKITDKDRAYAAKIAAVDDMLEALEEISKYPKFTSLQQIDDALEKVQAAIKKAKTINC